MRDDRFSTLSLRICIRPHRSGLGVPRCPPRATHDVRQGVAIAFVPSGLLVKSLGGFLKPLRMARLCHRALKCRLGHGPSRWGNTTIIVAQWSDSPKTKVPCLKSLIASHVEWRCWQPAHRLNSISLIAKLTLNGQRVCRKSV